MPQPGENIETLQVAITDDHFDSDAYQQLPGATRLIVRTEGGPYLFSIDGLVDRRELPASGETVILYSVSDPGRHTMHAGRSTPTAVSTDRVTAVLDVRPTGAR